MVFLRGTIFGRVYSTRGNYNNNTTQTDLDTDRTDNIPPEKLPTIWMRLSFIGKHRNILTKKFIKKTRRLLKGPCKFILNWRTTNYNCFLSCKDKWPDEYKSSVVYEFSCLGCRSSNIGKTDRCLYWHTHKEHSTRENSESTPTSTPANIFSTSSLFWNSRLTYRTLYIQT